MLLCTALLGFAEPQPSVATMTHYVTTPAGISDCSVHQPGGSVLEADQQIDYGITGTARAVLRDLLVALPAETQRHDVAFFDGRHLYVNHLGFASTVRAWAPIAGRSGLYQSNRGEIKTFPADLPVSHVEPNFVAPTPSDGGTRNRYSNVGYSWNCAFVDTTTMDASVKTDEGPYAYEGGYTGISGNSYSSSTDAGLQIQVNHNNGIGNIAAYLSEKPGSQNPCKNNPQNICNIITGGDFFYNAIFRVTAHFFIGATGIHYVDTTVEGLESDGITVGTTDIALVADPAWNLAGTGTVVKRITSIGQTIPGLCGPNPTVCRLDGSYVKSVHWSDSYVGTNNGATRVPWTSAQGNGFLCVPNDSRVTVNPYNNPAAETDFISLTTPQQIPCTR